MSGQSLKRYEKRSAMRALHRRQWHQCKARLSDPLLWLKIVLTASMGALLAVSGRLLYLHRTVNYIPTLSDWRLVGALVMGTACLYMHLAAAYK